MIVFNIATPREVRGAGDPVVTGPYENTTVGDWYIDAGETQVFKHGLLKVNGNLTINNTALLVLEDMDVEMHGNITIEIDSEESMWTRVTIKFPANKRF